MPERMTIYKWWWVWNFEKEEDWLNQKAQEGWALDGVGFCTFHFVRCEPGEYTIRIEMHDAEPEYLAFMADTGAEYMGRCVQWLYFRKKSELGAFALFSDLDSRIRHLNTIARMLATVGALNLFCGVSCTLSQSKFSAVNLLCACLLMYALGRICGKADELQKQRSLHE